MATWCITHPEYPARKRCVVGETLSRCNLDQVMACHWFVTRPLPEPTQTSIRAQGLYFGIFCSKFLFFISGTAFKIRRLQTFVEFSRCQSFYILKWKFIVVECVFVVVLFIFHKGTISPAYLSFAQPSPIITNSIITHTLWQNVNISASN